MSHKALDVFRAVRKLIRDPEHYDVYQPAAYWSEARGGWQACSIMDERAQRFTLFGAVWRSLPATTESGKSTQLRAFTEIMREGMSREGLNTDSLVRDRMSWHLCALDNWADHRRPHSEVISALNAVLINMARA